MSLCAYRRGSVEDITNEFGVLEDEFLRYFAQNGRHNAHVTLSAAPHPLKHGIVGFRREFATQRVHGLSEVHSDARVGHSSQRPVQKLHKVRRAIGHLQQPITTGLPLNMPED